jgi:hypothetical protein
MSNSAATANLGEVAHTSKVVVQVGHGFSIGNVLTLVAGAYVKAQADVKETAMVVGIVVGVHGDIFRILTQGYVSGLSGLTPSGIYYLSATTSGAMTTTEPVSPGLSKPVLLADSATSGYILNSSGGSSTGGGGTGTGFTSVLINADTSAVSMYRYLADTSLAAITVTLPANPAVGDSILIIDAKGTFGTNNVIVSGNGSNINGVSDGLALDMNNLFITLTYSGSTTRGWQLDIGSNGFQKLSSPTVFDNLVEEKTLLADSSTVIFSGLDSLADGDYHFQLNAQNGTANVSSIAIHINTDTTGTNYWTQRMGPSGSSANPGRTQLSLDHGYLYGNVNAKTSCFGQITLVGGYAFINSKAVLCTAGASDVEECLAGTVSVNQFTSITKITFALTGSATFKAGSVFRLYRTNGARYLVPYNPVAITSRTSDYPLKPGEVAYRTYTAATSVPLNIATEEGVYEVSIMGDKTVSAASSVDIGFSPNNLPVLSSELECLGSLILSEFTLTAISVLAPYARIKTLIPTMTSNSAPKGLVSASSIYSTNFDAYSAFDAGYTSKWHPSATTGWLMYQLTVAICVTSYTLQAPDVGCENQAPKTWTFECSQNGSTFTTLDTQPSQTAWSAHERRTFTFVNATSYLYYRINITANNGSANMGLENLSMNGPNMICFGNGRLEILNMQISTITKSKGIDLSYVSQGSSTRIEKGNLTISWVNTSTLWASLGTITFPFAQSGKIIIRRIL